MDSNSTLNDLAEFAQHEQELFAALNEECGQETATEVIKAPSERVIDNILAYSKVLSIRESKTMEHFEIVLN
jgi:hypothetical protein